MFVVECPHGPGYGCPRGKGQHLEANESSPAFTRQRRVHSVNLSNAHHWTERKISFFIPKARQIIICTESYYYHCTEKSDSVHLKLKKQFFGSHVTSFGYFFRKMISGNFALEIGNLHPNLKIYPFSCKLNSLTCPSGVFLRQFKNIEGNFFSPTTIFVRNSRSRTWCSNWRVRYSPGKSLRWRRHSRTSRKHFSSESQQVDLSDSEKSVGVTNQWCSNQTNDKYQRLASAE